MSVNRGSRRFHPGKKAFGSRLSAFGQNGPAGTSWLCFPRWLCVSVVKDLPQTQPTGNQVFPSYN